MPLETVWIRIVEKLNDDGILVFDENALWSELSNVWETFNVDGYFSQVIESMAQCLRQVIDNNGNWIRL